VDEAMTAYKDGLYVKVLEIAEAFLEENPKSFQMWLIQGNARQKLEDYEGAISSYEEALKLNDESPEVHTNIGVAYFNSGDIEKAHKLLKKAVKINEYYSPAHYFTGNLEYAEFRTKMALKCYDRAIELNPQYRDALYMRSAVYFEMEEYQKALQDINRVIEIDPDLAPAKLNKAIILVSAENYEEARKILSDLHPNLLDNKADYYYYLAESQFFSGAKEDACSTYSKAAELGDSESEEIYTKFCLTNAERKARKQKRTISISF
jgi:tetratricopeptide (TPR) repeat protein